MLSQLLFLPSVLVSGIMVPAAMLPRALQLAGKLLPATWGYELLCAASFQLRPVLALLGMAALCLALCGWRLKKIYSE